MHGSTTDSRPQPTQPRAIHNEAARATLIVFALLLGIGCASSVPPDTAESSVGTSAGGQTAQTTQEMSLDSTRPLLVEAMEYLAKSRRDSCAICAERNRDDAFERLTVALVPGTRYSTTPSAPLTKGDEPNELGSSSLSTDSIGFHFRFHTSTDHLVGVSAENWTPDSIAMAWSTAEPRTEFEGELELVGYPYGDGPTYLYSPSEGRVQVQCRLVSLRAIASR